MCHRTSFELNATFVDRGLHVDRSVKGAHTYAVCQPWGGQGGTTRGRRKTGEQDVTRKTD